LDYNLEAFKFYDTLGAKRVDNLTAMRITRHNMKDFLSTLVQLPDDIEVRFGVREDVSVVFSFMKVHTWHGITLYQFNCLSTLNWLYCI
jgi:hypothetical protein